MIVIDATANNKVLVARRAGKIVRIYTATNYKLAKLSDVTSDKLFEHFYTANSIPVTGYTIRYDKFIDKYYATIHAGEEYTLLKYSNIKYTTSASELEAITSDVIDEICPGFDWEAVALSKVESA